MKEKKRELKNKNKFGVLYLAFGEAYLCMALVSFSTLRKTNPNLPVCIITNVSFEVEKIGFWDENRDILIYLKKDTRFNREIKVSLDRYSPFEKTVFLDCDTLVVGDISRAKSYLDFFDFAIKLNPAPQKKQGKGNLYILDEKFMVSEVPHWNSGMLMFKENEKTKLFFKRWAELFKKYNVGYDQVSLAETIFKAEAKVLSLTKGWNFTPSLKTYLQKEKILLDNEIFIIHYTSQISYKIARGMHHFNTLIGGDTERIRKFIEAKRVDRKNKVGRIRYFLLLLVWKFDRIEIDSIS